jgi:nitroreductase
MDVYHTIRAKRAVRQFQEKPLPEEAVHTILNAGRLAQSSKNTQPWHFVAIQDRATLVGLSKMGHFAGHLAGAVLGVAIVTPEPEVRFSVMFDAGQAAAYMQLAAWELGIASCLATIYEPEQARELLGFPADLTVKIAISFGFAVPHQGPPPPPRKEGRRTFDEVIHWNRW